MYLSKTFQDAISLTKALGIKYSWIDSWCTIKNSEEDWKIEAAQMGNVYKNSYCNIAATRASNSNEGLFKRDLKVINALDVNVAWKDKYEGNFILTRKGLLTRSEVTNASLQQRDWVLQEQLLAPPETSFRRQQVFWACRKHEACEMYLGGLPVDHGMGKTLGYGLHNRLLHVLKQAVPGYDGNGTFSEEFWYNLADYCRRSHQTRALRSKVISLLLYLV